MCGRGVHCRLKTAKRPARTNTDARRCISPTRADAGVRAATKGDGAGGAGDADAVAGNGRGAKCCGGGREGALGQCGSPGVRAECAVGVTLRSVAGSSAVGASVQWIRRDRRLPGRSRRGGLAAAVRPGGSRRGARGGTQHFAGAIRYGSRAQRGVCQCVGRGGPARFTIAPRRRRRACTGADQACRGIAQRYRQRWVERQGVPIANRHRAAHQWDIAVVSVATRAAAAVARRLPPRGARRRPPLPPAAAHRVCVGRSGRWQGHPVRAPGERIRPGAHIRRRSAARGGAVAVAAGPHDRRDDPTGRDRPRSHHPGATTPGAVRSGHRPTRPRCAYRRLPARHRPGDRL
eukprot:ctg_321.g89